MKYAKFTLPLMAFVALVQCSPRSTQKFQADISGHWHLVKPDTGLFETLDIEDSISFWDNYDISNHLSPNNYCLRFNPKTGKEILPTQDEGWTSRFFLNGDTLNIGFDSLLFGQYPRVAPHEPWDSAFYFKYVKSTLSKCIIADRYGYRGFPVPSLPKGEFTTTYGAFCKDNCCLSFFVGYFYGEQDSVKIGYNDVFISSSDFITITSRIEDICGNYPSKIIFHSDKRVDAVFLDNLIKNFPKGYPIYQAVTGDGDIGLKLIRE